MEQGGFDFSVPIARSVSQLRRTFPPFSGATPQSRHASYTGARAAVQTWTVKQSAYLQILRQAGSLTDQEAATLLRLPLASINSTRNGINNVAFKRGEKRAIIADGFDVYRFTNGHGHECETKRTRWRINA